MALFGMLVAYDAAGNIIMTLDSLVGLDADGKAIGLVDFAAHEEAGGEFLDVWSVEQETSGVVTPAKGSKVWPEWLGGAAHHFQVELVGPPGAKHIAALIHKTSGYRRERVVIAAAITARIAAAGDQPADIRDLVGGPDRPMQLDPDGKTHDKSKDPERVMPTLPLVKRL